jgi:hypothetical protein
LLNIPTALDPVGGGNAHENREPARDAGPDRFGDAQGQPHAVLQAAAIGIAAEIGERGEKLVQEIAMRRVNLDHLESRFERAISAGLRSWDGFASI